MPSSPFDHLPPVLSDGRRLAFAAVVSAGLLEAAAGGVAAIATRDVFTAFGPSAAPPTTALMILALAGVVAALSRGGIRMASEWMGRHYAGSVRHKLYIGLANSSWSDLAQRRRSSIIIRFVGDLGAFRDWAGRGLADIVVGAIVIPVSVTVLIVLDTRLALAALLPLGIGSALGMIASFKLPRHHEALRDRQGTSAGVLGERALLAPMLDQLGRTERELRRLDREAEDLRRVGVTRAAVRSIARGLPEIGAAFGGAAMLAVAIVNGINTPTAAGALAALALTLSPLTTLGRAWDRFANWKIARDRVNRLLADGTRLPERSASDRTLHLSKIVAALKALDVATEREGRRFTGYVPRKRSIRALLRDMAGLESAERVLRDRRGRMPRIALVSEDAPIIKGSIRRNITLGAAKRPSDTKLLILAEEFGVARALGDQSVLDVLVDEEGRMLEIDVRVRLLLLRGAVMQSQVILCDGRLLDLLPDRDQLLQCLEKHTGAPVVTLMPEAVQYQAAE